MEDAGQQNQRLWSFPEGMLGHDDSVKGFVVQATDGDAGEVAWASYAPGESYLVVSLRHHLHETHHVIPAGAVERVSMSDHKVWLRLTRDEVERAPTHYEPSGPIETPALDAIRSTWATFAVRG